MGQYAEWAIEDEIASYRPDRNSKENTPKSKNNGVRSWILNNSSHIKGFYNKQTAFDDYDKRINKIIRLYCPDLTLKQGTLHISDNFKEFKQWYKQLNIIES